MTPSEEIYEQAIADIRADVEKAGDNVASLRRTGDVIELVYYDRGEDQGWRVLFAVYADGTRKQIGRNRYAF
jgi:hypothetical protein